MRFKNRIALVTGGGGGIGSATVERLASEGAVVYLMDRDANHVSQTQDALKAKGLSVNPFVGDVTALADLESVYGQVLAESGGVDIVVNVAGGSRAGYVTALAPSDWDELYALNLKSTINSCRLQSSRWWKKAKAALSICPRFPDCEVIQDGRPITRKRRRSSTLRNALPGRSARLGSA